MVLCLNSALKSLALLCLEDQSEIYTHVYYTVLYCTVLYCTVYYVIVDYTHVDYTLHIIIIAVYVCQLECES